LLNLFQSAHMLLLIRSVTHSQLSSGSHLEIRSFRREIWLQFAFLNLARLTLACVVALVHFVHVCKVEGTRLQISDRILGREILLAKHLLAPRHDFVVLISWHLSAECQSEFIVARLCCNLLFIALVEIEDEHTRRTP